jgi:hypothetical protein
MKSDSRLGNRDFEKALKLIAAAGLAAGTVLLLSKSGPSAFSMQKESRAPQAFSIEHIKELQAADKDILGNLELAKKDDPSYEAVAGIMPGMKKSREAVGVRMLQIAPPRIYPDRHRPLRP